MLDGQNRLDAIERLGWEIFDSNGRIKAEYASEFLIRDDTPQDTLIARIVSLNIRRRHLSAEERADLIIELLALDPEKSDRQIAKEIGSDHKTVGKARRKGEDVGTLPHVDKRRDSKGRKQPASKIILNVTDAPPRTTGTTIKLTDAAATQTIATPYLFPAEQSKPRPSAATMSLTARLEIKAILDQWLPSLSPEHLREITGYFLNAVAKLNSEKSSLAGGAS